VRRLAWFSPLAPSRSGVSAYSAAIVPLLQSRYAIDLYDEARAHDFVWRHRRQPYDLTVYQLGNSTAHAYMWGYVARYPGLVVLHDAQIHQARVLHLVEQRRYADYRTELLYSHPDLPPGASNLFMSGLGGSLFFFWALIRPLVTAARVVAVHNAHVAGDLRRQFPNLDLDVISMGVEAVISTSQRASAIRRRHQLPDEAPLFAAFGLVTHGKRIPQILQALAGVARRHPSARLMLIGESSGPLDALAEARALGVADRLVLAGYVNDTELPDYLTVADVCLCLRWPTAQETSAAWLRCLAAGKPTLVTNLKLLDGVPRIDAQTAVELDARNEAGDRQEPLCLSVNLMDEVAGIQAGLTRLADDRELRDQMGRAAREWWSSRHTIQHMYDDYVRVIERAMRAPVPDTRTLPAHFRDDSSGLTRGVLAEFGLDAGTLFGEGNNE